MRGFSQLIAMRKRGSVPDAVFIETDELDMRRVRFDPSHPDLQIEPADNLQRADLRALVGLTCFVSGTDAERVEAVTAACTRAQAGRVIASTHHHKRNGEFEVVRVTDTEGDLSWQKS